MSAYPWGESTPSQLDFNLPDSAALRDGRLLFEEQGRPPVDGAGPHDWAAVVGASRPAAGGETGSGFRGPQEPPVVCPPSGEGQPDPPTRCDDTAYGKGAGGRLRYELSIPPGQTRTLWIAVAGSERGSGGCSPHRRRGAGRSGGRAAREGRPPGGPVALLSRSRCPAIRCSPRASTGASRTSRTRSRWPRISRCERRTRASATRRPRANSRACAFSAPAGPTIRGCLRPTASTRPSPPWRWGSSSR